MNKKTLSFLFITAICILCGCSSGVTVERMNDWSFQYNEDTNDYSLFFGLEDVFKNETSAACTVEIRIENDNEETVYIGIKEITTNDFGTYTSDAEGKQFLANVRIDEEEITPGSTDSGTVHFTVTGEYFSFSEADCTAYACLPLKETTLIVNDLPIEVVQKGIFGGIEGKYTITDVSYYVDTSFSDATMLIVISGEKTSGNSSTYSYDKFSYKLYDSEEYLVDSGQVLIGTGLDAGDKFKSEDTYIYGITPGETYTLVLTDFEW
ncbi:hypothetical protein SAMN05216351_12317 [Pseudobutyrivibrio sp. JW11]|uniref:hypothetical protein n=1 Tax=Pseudobutyrivibrio sp. JW11 TaxID=1855302 RepID=UPI0008EC93BE|nr:hypothetical protein [Pseudobutyrivibrio sp. JW11]SFO65018.1 hypothetical protein SAMN05216351_12317 [Pseudobutyrivibrio sp. JW11]